MYPQHPPWRLNSRVAATVADTRRIHAQIEAGYTKALRQHAHLSGELRRQEREAWMQEQIHDLEYLGMRYQTEIERLNGEVQALQRSLADAKETQNLAKLAYSSGVGLARQGRPGTPPPPYSSSRSLDIPASSPTKAQEIAKVCIKAARREVSMRADRTPDGTKHDTAATANWLRTLRLDELLADVLCGPLNEALSRGGADELSADARRVGQLAFVRSLGADGDAGIMATLLADALEEIPRRVQREAIHAGLVPPTGHT